MSKRCAWCDADIADEVASREDRDFFGPQGKLCLYFCDTACQVFYLQDAQANDGIGRYSVIDMRNNLARVDADADDQQETVVAYLVPNTLYAEPDVYGVYKCTRYPDTSRCFGNEYPHGLVLENDINV